uniref:Uncharacterized protein n=1 Tax=Arundo donax TaxID=35708 RepID=A0A0A9G0S7_ARUDO
MKTKTSSKPSFRTIQNYQLYVKLSTNIVMTLLTAYSAVRLCMVILPSWGSCAFAFYHILLVIL